MYDNTIIEQHIVQRGVWRGYGQSLAVVACVVLLGKHELCAEWWRNGIQHGVEVMERF